MSGVRVALVLVIMSLFVKPTEAVDERIRVPDIEASFLLLLLLLFFCFQSGLVCPYGDLLSSSSVPRECACRRIFLEGSYLHVA